MLHNLKKQNKTISLDSNIIDKLSEESNSSKLINDLLIDYYDKGENYEKEEILENVKISEKNVKKEEKKILAWKKKLEILQKKEQILKDSYKNIPKEILQHFKDYPNMTEEILQNRYNDIYKAKYPSLKWEELLEVFNKSKEQ